jgi:hypothetical protein
MADIEKPSSGQHVLVGCKLPHGMILELLAPADKENFMQARNAGKQITLKGACSLYNQTEKKSRAAFDYAITAVDKSFWDEWYPKNKDREFMRNGLVFVTDGANAQSRAEGIAKERHDVRTGLEPLAQENDARMKRAEPATYAEPL